MAAIELAGLSVCGPGGTVALHGLDLTVADGELVTLVGPGSSTLLRAVLGLAEVPDGELRIGGRDVTALRPAERDLAMVFQDHAPYPHLRVRDNLGFPLRFAGLPAAEVDARVREVAAALELTVHLDRMPSQLSGGQRQRVAIGRALVRRDPAAYLLDEPGSADARVRPLLRQRVAGTTTLWACADPAEAAALGDRVAVLRDGRLEQVGTPQELAAAPASLEVARLGPLSVLLGTADGTQLRTPLGTLPLGVGADTVLVGIRPGDLHETGEGIRVTALAGDGVAPDGTARLRHPGMARDAAEDPRLSPDLLARVDPAGRRAIPLLLDPAKVLLFDPDTGRALPRS